ncbi:MAG: HAMP domain-containing sensor histidine kinase [bacterium]
MNSCYIFVTTLNTTQVTLANYSHIIPIVLSLILGCLVFFKSKNLFSRLFLAFIVVFSLWLIGDLITWTATNYRLIYTVWSFLDYLEIVFYILGLYFATVFIRKSDISALLKIAFFALTVPALYMTVTKQSVLGFNQPMCEAFNNDFLGYYKLALESLILIVMAIYMLVPFLKKLTTKAKAADLIVLGSMFLFLATFGVTEYLASTTGYYEMNLYSLFLLPIFLIAIIYSVFELDIFNFKIIGTHYLVIGLMVLIAGQLFFISSETDRLLTILTIVITLGLSVILFRNLKKESDQRVRIEKLSGELQASKMRIEESNLKLEDANDKLKGLDKLKTEFLSLASHQLRSPLTAINGYTSMLLAGDFGAVNDKQKEMIDRVFESSRHLTTVVEDLLNVSKIEQGGMKYTMAPFDFEKAAKDLATDLSVTAEKKGLKLSFETDGKAPYTVNGDMEKLRQVMLNLIDNSIKYTKEGSIKVKLAKDDKKKKITWSVSDTGMGIPPEIKETLFQKFARGEGAKMNTTGSGLGLYLARIIAEAHKGRVWADSEGAGKGSTFSLELDAA